MRKVVLFIAMSLDGYIADKNGGVKWLEGQSEKEGDGGAYEDFVKSVDTVLMGWNTYHQIVTELSPDEWVYDGLSSYVLTSRKPEASAEEETSGQTVAKGITFANETICDIIGRLKQEEGRNIWICGGADVVRQAMEAGLIDEYRISVIPVVLGEGIPLFGAGIRETRLKLERVKTYNGITELVYTRRDKRGHFDENEKGGRRWSS